MVLVLAALASIGACAGDPPGSAGSVTLAMSTDLTIDDDIATVGLYLQQLDGTRVVNTWGWTQNAECDANHLCTIKFPATFVVGAGAAQSTVRVRVVGFGKDRAPVVMRESRFQVATDKVNAVRFPLLWVNSGVVSDGAQGVDLAGTESGALSFDPFSRWNDGCVSTDGTPQTRDDRGECVSVDSFALTENYDPDAGLGDDKQACLDPKVCFGEGERRFRTAGLHDEIGGCSLEVPYAVDARSVNIALIVPPSEPGYLVDDLRIRPLALGTSAEACAGNARCAQATASGAENLFFPSAVCTKLRRAGGDNPSFLVSLRCPSRTVDEPICATWNISEGTVPAEAPRPAPAESPATSFEVTGITGALTSFATQGAELVLGSREADHVTAHRFVAPPYAATSTPKAADAVYTLPQDSTMELLRVSTPRPNVGPNGAIDEYSEAYALTAPDRISYLPPGGGPAVPVRFAIDCTNPQDHWQPYLGNAHIRAVSMARIDATAKDNAARLQQIADEGGVGDLITPKLLGAIGLGIISYERDDANHPGQTEWMNTVGVVGSPLLSGQLHFGAADSLRDSSPDPTCIQVFTTVRHDGDPGNNRCDGVDGGTCCSTGPCAGVFAGAGGPLGRSTEIAPNELGNFIPFATNFAAADPAKQFRWCGMEDGQFLIDKIGTAITQGGMLTDLPQTAISCFNEYFDYTKGSLAVGSLAIGGGFRSADDQDDRKLFALLDPDADTRRLTLFETTQSLFKKDADGQYIRTDAGNRSHQERLWHEIENKVFATPQPGTHIVSYSGDGGQTNVVCYVAETPTVACYDQDGRPVSLPLDTGFVSAIHLDDTSLTDDENNLYIALQCTPEKEHPAGRVFVYRVPWTSITGAGVRDPLPNPCRR